MIKMIKTIKMKKLKLMMHVDVVINKTYSVWTAW